MQEDIDAVIDVLRSDFLTQGPTVAQFERSIEDYTGARHALAVNSATSALHLSCLALGLGQGDWLWTSPISFVASANCALYCGAKVDFVDINPKTYNLCTVSLRAKLEHAQRDGCLPKVIVPVHFSGQSCDMREIKSLADQYGIRLIEDASHAIGGKYLEKAVGGCEYSDITVFSFHPVKIITTGEGGIVATNSKELAEKTELLRSHGITRNTEIMCSKPEGDWCYEQLMLGFNYRMTDIQAALGISQMRRLDSYISIRHRLAQRYTHKLEGLPVILPYQSRDTYSAFHLYVVLLKQDENTLSRKAVFDLMREKGVGVNVHYIPIHTQPHYMDMGFRRGDFPRSEAYYAQAISLPIYAGLSDDQQDEVISVLTEVVGMK